MNDELLLSVAKRHGQQLSLLPVAGTFLTNARTPNLSLLVLVLLIEPVKFGAKVGCAVEVR
jgi:hypothetical protein